MSGDREDGVNASNSGENRELDVGLGRQLEEALQLNTRLTEQVRELEQQLGDRGRELELVRDRATAAEAALGRSDQRFNDVANIVGEYLWEVDANYRFTFVAEQVSFLLGYDAKKLLGSVFFDYMPVSDAAFVRESMRSCAESQSVFTSLLHRAVDKKGRIVWQRSSGLPLYNAGGEFLGFRGASLDVTEQERSKSEMRQLVIALEQAGDGVMILGPDNRLKFVNQAFVKMFGYGSKSELIGESWKGFFHVSQLEELQGNVSRAMNSNKSYGLTSMGVRLDGSEFSGYFSVKRLPNYDFLWVCRDESERLSNLMTLRTHNSQLDALIQSLKMGVIFEGDTNGSLIYNRSLKALLDLKDSELRGLRKVTDLFMYLFRRSQDLDYREQIEQLLAWKAERQSLELSLAEGVYLVFDRIPVTVERSFRGALWTIRDVSEERQQEAILEEAREQAEAGARAKSNFLANMSHEIRTPLNGICGMARLLHREPLSEKALEHVLAIQASGDSLLHVLNDILDFSKVEAGKLDLDVAEFDMAQLLDTTFTILQTKASENFLRFDFIYPDASMPFIEGDASRLGEVLVNLLGNAIKFTNEGSITLAVDKVGEVEGHVTLSFSVKDTGIGMGEEELDRIFQPFSQADSSISRQFGGTGLGLSISRNLIQLMGGELTVDSAPNVGSCFAFELQFPAVPQRETPALHEEVGKVIFVCSESDTLFESLRSILAYSGFRVLRVAGVEEARRCYAELDAVDDALLLLDRIFLPPLDAADDLDLSLPLDSNIRRIVIVHEMVEYDISSIGCEFLYYPFKRFNVLSLVHRVFSLETPVSHFRSNAAEDLDRELLEGMHILLAEDNLINQKVGRLTIEGFGANVDIACNGREAVEMADQKAYDLVLMDIRMPEMDGVEACKRLRAAGCKLPIYALTADAMKGDRERFIESGMNGYLSKPLEEKKLLQLLISERSELDPSLKLSERVIDRSEEEDSEVDVLIANSSNQPVLKLEEFLSLIGGDRSLGLQILEEFQTYSQQYIQDGRDALMAADWGAVQSVFHKLAGSCASVCAIEMRECANAVELAMTMGWRDVGRIRNLIQACEAALLRVKAERLRIVRGTD